MKTITKLGSLITLFFAIFLLSSVESKAQDIEKRKQYLISKDWTITEVKREKLTKQEVYALDEGNTLHFSIDKKFGFKNNKNEYLAGKWVMAGKKSLLLTHGKGDGSSDTASSRFKIVKISETRIILKKLDKPKGKFVLQ
ncbi:hypothetical protein KMW28_02750 [Flammeovirga yaeyamensis]|uniref:Lipocalin-like domain-containing protein n=1 Tax=Flammeovirga yaeyamensis TaxID=367791 RepID=A0AAX1N8I2_9BACT|nr:MULTISPECIES: hypothetical protein [Flammeovirga]ANQ50050.1 hypothetical protein MY04_2681 [Flammeovirga sp. MY04]MBB3700432.1 hypothetical protein [Flammeovirga yaeyamensis]NMF36944.1 hypothetical protein [Flammeovirga yaeyamensis]QWG02510.1 hypothetical protein KMW28_02750 [Flammeovirga yaeyamensis]